MSRHTSHRVLQQCHSNVNSHIWTSEKLVFNSFRRYLLLLEFRRDGSSAPGPVEARKRQAKRRMMNVANAGHIMPIEAEVLTGMAMSRAQRYLNWEPPRQLEQRQSESGQPAGQSCYLVDQSRY